MAYEYKEWISIAIDEKLAWRGFDPDEETRVRDELEEVYVKGKAFDKISDVIKKAEFYDRDTALDIIEIVEDLEDK